MASKHIFKTTLLSLLVFGSEVIGQRTCPGFPGYCSESFPGQTCSVVCSRGRNNVPLCQEDGTWTDIPRCIEHDPGVPNQLPGVCPGVSGYCSDGFLGERCNFACSVGPPVNSVCSEDGTWEPYPTCTGDLRETQDGCLSCPGPNGRPRNRTAEAILGLEFHNPVPAAGAASGRTDAQGRPVRPSFSGNQAFGVLPPQQRPQQVASQVPRQFPQQSQVPVFQPKQVQAPAFQPQQVQAFQPQQVQAPAFQQQQVQRIQSPVFQPQQVPQRAPNAFSPEQRRIIEQGLARVQGFPGFQQQQQPLQVRGGPQPLGPRPDQPRFGPFDVVQPSQENIIDVGPLPSFPAIPDDGPGLKLRQNPGEFGPFQLIDL